MLTRIAEWSSVLGALLGAAGLIYSILAFRAANRAKQSAEEARRDVRSLVAADKFHHLNASASELFSHIEHENLPVASYLARDLRFEIKVQLRGGSSWIPPPRNAFERLAGLHNRSENLCGA